MVEEIGKCHVCSSTSGVREVSHKPFICLTCAETVEARLEGTDRKQWRVAREYSKLRSEIEHANDYLLRGVPSELMNKAQHLAVDQGTSVKDVFIQAIEAYLK